MWNSTAKKANINSRKEKQEQQHSWDKSDLLGFTLMRNDEEEEVPANLNSLQLCGRWWYTTHCSQEKWWAFATSTRILSPDTWYLTFKLNFLRPQFVQNRFFWSCAKAKEKKKKKGTLLIEAFHCSTPLHTRHHWVKTLCRRLPCDCPAAVRGAMTIIHAHSEPQ